jgi:hypothetical protein
LPGGNAVTDFRRRWAPLIIVATYCVALLMPALMPSVQAKDALPLGEPAFSDSFGSMGAGGPATGPSEQVMAALHEQASAALRELQASSRQ